MIRRIAFGLIAVAVLWMAGRALVHALASNETLIRWKLEDAVNGFNRTRMSPILDFISHDFVDQSSGAHRDDLRAGLASIFFTAKDPETKKFPYVAVVVPGTLAIERDAVAKGRAHLRSMIRVTDMRGGKERVALEFQLDGLVVDGDDGWQLVDAHADVTRGSERL